MFDEVPGNVLQGSRDILADPVLGRVALRTRPLRLRHLMVVNLALNCSSPDAATTFPPAFLLSLGLLGLCDLTIQLGVLSCLGLRIDRRRRVSLARLTTHHLEKQLKLPGIDALRSLPGLLSPQLRHQELQISRLAQHRVQGGSEKLERLLDLPFGQQGLRRLSNLPKRGRLTDSCALLR